MVTPVRASTNLCRRHVQFRLVVIGCSLLASCTPTGDLQGSLRTNRAPSTDTGPTDTLSATDGGSKADSGPRVDSGVANPPMVDAGRVDAGQALPDAGAPAACPTGFVRAGSTCVPNAPAPFSTRTEAEICGRWRADYVTTANEWTETAGSNDACDPGTLSQAGHDNAIVRTNLYRWLCNLSAVSETAALRDQQQQCAVLQHAMGRLDHRPPSSVPCYTAEGAAGAGSSNLARGGRDLASSVDLYVGDGGVASLGHRRWVLNPSATQTAFGYKPAFSCMYSFSRSGSVDVDFVAWPPPGYVPAAAARGTWSLSSDTYRADANTRVEVATDDGPFEVVSHRDPGGNYGWGSVMAFEMPRDVWQAGKTVRVRYVATRGGDLEYTVRFVDCP